MSHSADKRTVSTVKDASSPSHNQHNTSNVSTSTFYSCDLTESIKKDSTPLAESTYKKNFGGDISISPIVRTDCVESSSFIDPPLMSHFVSTNLTRSMVEDSCQSRLGYMATRKMIEQIKANGYFGDAILYNPSVSYPEVSLNLPEVRTSVPLEVLHCGVFESIKVATTTGSSFNIRYVVFLVDDFSRYVTLHAVSGHKDALACVEDFVKEQNELPGRTVKAISVDRSMEFGEWLLKKLIRTDGVALKRDDHVISVTEEMNRFLLEIVRVLLDSAKLDDSFWLYALEYAVFTFNRIMNECTYVSPFERFQSSFNNPFRRGTLKPDLGQLYAFGAQIGQFGILLGYREDGLSKVCYRAYDSSIKRVSLVGSNKSGFEFLKLESNVQVALHSNELDETTNSIEFLRKCLLQDEEADNRPALQQRHHQQMSPQEEDKWHHFLCHIGYELIDLMSRTKGFGTIQPCVRSCEHCSTISTLRAEMCDPINATSPGELVHVYLCDTFVMSTIDRSQYVLIFVDEYSRFITLEYPKFNSDMKLYLSLNKYIDQHKDTARRFITCQDKDLFGRKKVKKIEKRHVEFEFSNCDSKIAKSTGRLLEVMAKIMLHQSGLDDDFWKYAMNTAVHVLNRVAHSDLVNQQIVVTPSMKLKSLPEPYPLSYLHTFGCECTFTSEVTRNVENGIFVGFDENRRNGRFPCLIWRDRSVESVVSGVLFRDLSFPAKVNNNLVRYSWESIRLKERKDDSREVERHMSLDRTVHSKVSTSAFDSTDNDGAHKSVETMEVDGSEYGLEVKQTIYETEPLTAQPPESSFWSASSESTIKVSTEPTPAPVTEPFENEPVFLQAPPTIPNNLSAEEYLLIIALEQQRIHELEMDNECMKRVISALEKHQRRER